MAFPVASGHPQHSGILLPQIFSTLMLVTFYGATVLAEITNTDYEGEIASQGDTVTIRSNATVAINDYTKGQVLDYEKLVHTAQDLLIDKGKYWAFSINKVDQVQSDIDFLTAEADDAGQQMKIQIDKDVLGAVYLDVDAANKDDTAGLISGDIDLGKLTAPFQLTKTTVVEKIVDCGTVLDEQDVPGEGRFIVLPAWATGLIKKGDLKDASLAGDGTSILRSGRIGMIDSFTVFQSNHIATAIDTVKVWNCIFGHKTATTFASQVTEQEQLMNPTDFGTLVRGLQVFGWKVVKPEALGLLYVKK